MPTVSFRSLQPQFDMPSSEMILPLVPKIAQPLVASPILRTRLENIEATYDLRYRSTVDERLRSGGFGVFTI
jgi:hypothetical protein